MKTYRLRRLHCPEAEDCISCMDSYEVDMLGNCFTLFLSVLMNFWLSVFCIAKTRRLMSSESWRHHAPYPICDFM